MSRLQCQDQHLWIYIHISKTTPHSSFIHLHTHTRTQTQYILLCMSAQEHVTSTTRGDDRILTYGTLLDVLW